MNERDLACLFVLQEDATYAHNIETFVCKVSALARKIGGGEHTSSLRAYSLQCLSAMVIYS